MNEYAITDSSVIKKEDYITEKDWDKLQSFIKDKNPPFLVLFKDKARENYKALKSLCGPGKIYYAVKACPNVEILESFVELVSNFDIASVHELDLILSL
jgi:ornithine decarboxylase